jgi:hypothetical protein
MNNPLMQTLRAILAVLLLSGLCLVAAGHLAWSGAGRLPAIVLIVLPLAVVFTLLFRRVQSEDRVVRLEAALCREQNARSQADHALAEADLLLARLTARSRAGTADPASQAAAIHAELLVMQRQAEENQSQLALRLELLCLRVERLTSSLRKGLAETPRAAQSG